MKDHEPVKTLSTERKPRSGSPRRQGETDTCTGAAGDSLILRTGWCDFVNEAKWRDELSRVSLELARWCVENRVKLLGVEPPSVADVNDLPELIRIHQTLLGGGVLPVEGLTNLEAIRQEKVFFAALPLKPLRGAGSPVRVFAIEGCQWSTL